MANTKGRGARSIEVMVLPWRMTDMLSRTRFDMSRALKGEHLEALKTAAKRCVRCAAQTRCEQWIAQHQRGEGNPVPSFCPNAHFIRSNRPCSALPPMQGAKAAQKLLEAAPFDPATIKVLMRALEDAWIRLETTTEPETPDDTWLSLAHAIVSKPLLIRDVPAMVRLQGPQRRRTRLGGGYFFDCASAVCLARPSSKAFSSPAT